MQCKCKVVTRMQFCCLWKIYLCLLTPNCTQNHVVTYIKNYTRKIYALLIGWNQVHLSCNTSAKLKHEYKLHIARTLSKLRLPCLWEMPFSCILFLGNIVISRAISCKGTLEKRSPYLVRAVRPISLEKQISFISCVLQIPRQLRTCMKTKVRPIGSLYFPDVTLKDN